MIYLEAISGIFLAGRCSLDEKIHLTSLVGCRCCPHEHLPEFLGQYKLLRSLRAGECRCTSGESYFHNDKRGQKLELVNNISLIKLKQ